MSAMRGIRLAALGAALFLFVGASAVEAQQSSVSIGSGVQFQGFSFSEELGSTAANLLMIPVAVRVPAGGRLSFDLYSAWAQGKVERDGVVYTLDGPVDTQLRSQLRATDWAVLTLAVNLPTGHATHDANEAIVASVLATDILGFREANWGLGTAVTTGIATARRAGPWGLGVGASYRIASEYEPAEAMELKYAPGNEARVRFALDRNIGVSSKLTAGLTVQEFSSDQLGGVNLFQAGRRIRGDVAYAFRTGSSTWTTYAANLWRDKGDIALDAGETEETGTQNLFVAGVTGNLPISPRMSFRPALDIRVQSREEGIGSGWVMGVGGDLPVRGVGPFDAFPRAQFLLGSLEAEGGDSHSLWGAEAGLTLRWRP
jgi:hypothetical protein